MIRTQRKHVVVAAIALILTVVFLNRVEFDYDYENTVRISLGRQPAGQDTPYGDWLTNWQQLTPAPYVPKHAVMLHLDGFRSDVFKELLQNHQLPHFEFLLQRGKVSFESATVDKTETFKVIESYLTSRLDTYITGWWQYSRKTKDFRNYWLDPDQVLNYALGTEFPVYPTILDFLAAKNENIISGFGLHRRGVPFKNYGRAYYEGLKAALGQFTYFNQAQATMKSSQAVYERIARSANEKTPALNFTVLAPADEFGHLVGVAAPKTRIANDEDQFCISRYHGTETEIEKKIYKIWFELLDADKQRVNSRGGRPFAKLAKKYFAKVTRDIVGITQQFCFKVPLISAYLQPLDNGPTSYAAQPEQARTQPEYVLGMMMVDYQLGELVDTLRSIRFAPDGTRHFVDLNSIENIHLKGISSFQNQILSKGEKENSLFENTLFVLFGDHGMGDTKFMMWPVAEKNPDPNRNPGSSSQKFIEYLNAQMGLTTPKPGDQLPGAAVQIGVDYQTLPVELNNSFAVADWQDSETQAMVKSGEAWSSQFYGELKTLAKNQVWNNSFWMRIVWPIAKAKLDSTFESNQKDAEKALARMYLRGDSSYLGKENAYQQEFFRKHVRLIYGGAARNNAELFLPKNENGNLVWTSRPSINEILSYRATASGKTLMQTLRELPAVGLMFIRANNNEIDHDRKLPLEMKILVLDRFDNKGTITVHKNSATGRLMFSYQKDPTSPYDPIGYDGLNDGRFIGTYNEWNDLSVKSKHYYHNIVAGVGSYLYSANPAIGDITLMRSQGWDFGDNAGGHGGVHREEKMTVMMVSAPGIKSPESTLMAHSKFASRQSAVVYPTVLDISPTVIRWLGYKETLGDFARTGFEKYLSRWISNQKSDVLNNLDNIGDLNQALTDNHMSGLRPSQLKTKFDRLLNFIPQTKPELPDYSSYEPDGNYLELE
jgi:hypothetical protein